MIEKILIIALIVQAIHYTMQEGEIFGKLGDWFSDHLPEAIHNPIFNCAVCMTPWYGTIVYWCIWHGQLFISRERDSSGFYTSGRWLHSSILEWLVVIIAATGLNVVLNALMREKVD